MGDQYGLPDFQRLLTRTHFPESLLPQPSESPYLAHHRNMAPSPPPYHEPPYVLSNGHIAMPSGLLRFNTTGAIDFTAAASASAAVGGGGWSLGNMEGGNSRWPRQETLTLLEIRSRLDSKFKEANQKGPLWDEVSRYIIIYYNCTKPISLLFFFFFFFIFNSDFHFYIMFLFQFHDIWLIKKPYLAYPTETHFVFLFI